MFKIKRPAIIGILVVLLVFTGYLNHQLTEQAQRKASKEYKNYELGEMEKQSEGEALEVGDEDLEIEIVDNLLDDANEETGKDGDESNVDIVDSDEEDSNDALEAMYNQAGRESKNYFVEYRLSRDKLRATLIDRLDEIVNNTNTNDKVREDAQREIMVLGDVSQKELQIEGLIKGKGYDDALVFLTDDDIKIVVSTDELNEQDMVKILEIVHSETDYDTNNIKIMKNE